MSVLSWVVVDIVLFFFLLIFGIRIFKIGRGYCRFVVERKWYGLFLSGILIFCLFDKTSGDYFHYQSIIQEYLETKYPQNHLEYPYLIIIESTFANYFLFRLIVWGGALFIWNCILKLLSLQNTLSLTVFVLFMLIPFSCVRMSLGLVIFYLGFILFWKYLHTNIIYVLAGVFCLISSLFFHKALLLLFILFPITFIKINKYLLILMIIAFPFIVQFVNTYVLELFFLDIEVEGLSYLSGEKVELGVGMKLYNVFLMISLTISLALIIWDSSAKNVFHLPLYYQRLLYIIIYVYYIVLIVSCLNVGDNTLYARFRDMLYPPFVLIFSYYCMQNRLRKFALVFLFASIVLADAYYLMYAYYLKSLGLGV